MGRKSLAEHKAKGTTPVLSDDMQHRYEQAKINFLNNPELITENKELYTRFFEEHEYRLKRINDLRTLDKGTYRTLYLYIQRFKNVEKWFNKPLKDLTEADIKRVYDGLEEGTITRADGKPIECRSDYYDKVFKSKLFRMIDKDEIAKKVIEYRSSEKKEVRFIEEKDFRKLLRYANSTQKQLLLWLAWDIGENINALLQLTKKDFYKEINPHTKEPEYRINLRREILKRSRKARSEITNYPETVELLDEVLGKIDDNAVLFDYDYANAKKIIDRITIKTDVKCIPNGEKPTWKDLRSGMACDLLKKGWSTDEVNARLGHRPSSDDIDKYVNFLAIDRHRPKKKVQQYEMEKLKQEIEDAKLREKSQQRETERIKQDFDAQLKAQREELLNLLKAPRVMEAVKRYKEKTKK